MQNPCKEEKRRVEEEVAKKCGIKTRDDHRDRCKRIEKIKQKQMKREKKRKKEREAE